MIQRSLLRRAQALSSSSPLSSSVIYSSSSRRLLHSPSSRLAAAAASPLSPFSTQSPALSSRLLSRAAVPIRSFSASTMRANAATGEGNAAAGEGVAAAAAQDGGAGAGSAATAEGAVEDAAKKVLEGKDREIIDLKDKYLRSVAEFRNLQDRTARDISSARDFAITRFAKDLVESVDNLDRALATVPAGALEVKESDASNKALRDLHGGLTMTETALMQTLGKHGLERFDPSVNGEKFNPNLHEATFMTKMEGKVDGTCFETIQKGFTLNGRVIRAAKVGVVKNS